MIEKRPVTRTIQPLAAHSEPARISGADFAAPDIRRYIGIIAKRWRWVIGAFLFVVGSAAIGVALTKPVYMSYVELQVEPEEKVLPYQQVSTSGAGTPEYIRTQTRILTSGVLSRNVAETLSRRYPSKAKSSQPGQPPTLGFPSDGTPEDLHRLSSELLGMIEIEPILSTQMIRVYALADDPESAAVVSQTWAEEFISYNALAQNDSTAAAVDFLQKEVDQVKSRVEQSEQASVDFAQENPHVLLVDEGHNLLFDRLGALHESMAMLEVDLQTSLAQAAWSENSTSIPQEKKTSVMLELETEQAGLDQELARLREKFGPRWPDVQNAEAALESASRRLATEIDRIKALNSRSIEIARQQLEAVRAEISAEEDELSTLNSDVALYGMLQRESATEQRVYEGLLQRLREAAIETKLKSNNVQVVTHARVVTSPEIPNIPLSAAIALSVGLVAGVLAAFVAESFDHRLQGAEHVEALLGLPTLGIVPYLGDLTKRLPAASTEPPGSNGAASPGIEELYRSIRSSLLFTTAASMPGVTVVTSALPGEGKSVTAFNLAASLARSGESTLLVGADMHNPTLAKQFGFAEANGLPEVLAGRQRLEDAVIDVDLTNLHFLGSSEPDESPIDLVTRSAFEKLIRNARSQFKYVVIDTAPQLITGEAAIIGSLADGVVLVVEATRSPQAAIKRARMQLDAAGAEVLGVLVNKAPHDKFSAGSYSDHGYYRGYNRYSRKGSSG